MSKSKNTPKSAVELGRLGGNTILKKYGVEHFKKLARISVEHRHEKALQKKNSLLTK